jgi:hypothetical protein
MSNDIDNTVIDSLTDNTPAPEPTPAEPPKPADETPPPAPPKNTPSVDPRVAEAARTILNKDADQASVVAALKEMQRVAGVSDDEAAWLFAQSQEDPEPTTNSEDPTAVVADLVRAQLEQMGISPKDTSKRIEEVEESMLDETREWLAATLEQGVQKQLEQGTPAEYLARVKEVDGDAQANNSAQYWGAEIMNRAKAILREKLRDAPGGRLERKWVPEAIEKAAKDVSDRQVGMVGAAGRIGRTATDYSMFEKMASREAAPLDPEKAATEGASNELKRFLSQQATQIAQMQQRGQQARRLNI